MFGSMTLDLEPEPCCSTSTSFEHKVNPSCGDHNSCNNILEKMYVDDHYQKSIEIEPSSDDNDCDSMVVGIDNLPDELLEHIFSFICPYDGLESAKLVCKRWNCIVKDAIKVIKNNFISAAYTGELQCVKMSPTYGEHGRLADPWISERYGQMCCSSGETVYIVGGSTSNRTQFNDMWKFDLRSKQWGRVICNGTYPSPKTLATCVLNGDNFYLFGGLAQSVERLGMNHLTPPFPNDELHRFNLTTRKWSLIPTENGPQAVAGHSASAFSDEMVIFGGRMYHDGYQFTLTEDVWVFDFTIEEWFPVKIDRSLPSPGSRYGQTQIAVDDIHTLVIGGCRGPNHIFNDVWLLKIETDMFRKKYGYWRKMDVTGNNISANFHYGGCKFGDTVVFLERESSMSPYQAFLHFFDPLVPANHGVAFEPSREAFSSNPVNPRPLTMSIYCLNISKVLTHSSVSWSKEPISKNVRPDERFLYSAVSGKAELIVFAGYFKEPGGRRCRVSNDLFILKAKPKPRNY